jgi:toxin ParE1/3/4
VKRWRLSFRAEEDLKDIVEYVSQNDPIAAERLLRSLFDAFLRLTAYPYLGQACGELHPDALRFPVRNYVVFYRVTPSGIEVARVLHGARNLELLLRPS